MAITYTSGEQVEVYRFSLPATILIPLVAVFLQAWVPLYWDACLQSEEAGASAFSYRRQATGFRN